MMGETIVRQRSVSSFAWRVALLGVALVLIAWGAYELDKRSSMGPVRQAWLALLDDMRRSGEPLSFADLHSGTGAESTAWRDWLEEFEGIVEGSALASFGSSPVLAPMRNARLVRLQMAAAMSGRYATITTDGDPSVSWERFQSAGGDWASLAAEDATVEELRALRDAGAGISPALERLDGMSNVDVERWIERDRWNGSPVGAALSAAQILALDAFLALHDGNTPALEQAVRRLLKVASLTEQAPNLVQAQCYNGCGQWICVVLDATSEALSPQFVEKEVEPFLTSLDLGASVARDLMNENLVFLTYPEIRSALGMAPDTPLEALPEYLDAEDFRAWQTHVEDTREVAGAMRLPYAKGRVGIDTVLSRGVPSFRGPFSSVLSLGTPALHNSMINLQACADIYASACETQLRILFSRIRLSARSGGLERARTLASGSSDSYDGNPLHLCLEADGKLRVWSVGPDGIDQTSAGAAPSDDVELVLERHE